MKRVLVNLFVLAVISLSYTYVAAQESSEALAEGGRVPYEALLSELERQREENQALRDEIQDMKHRMNNLLLDQIGRQRDEIADLRDILREQYDFLRGMLKEQYTLMRLAMERQFMIGPGMPEPGVEARIRELEEAAGQHPDSLEIRMELGNIYREVGNIDAAIEQYKMALTIDPDFDPPYHALKEMGYEFPRESREPERLPERLPEKSTGTVISASEAEVRLEVYEGDVLIFKVPLRRREGDTAIPEDLSAFARSLDAGTRVRILWRRGDEGRIIQRIDRVEEER